MLTVHMPSEIDWDDKWSVLVSGNNDGLHTFHKSDILAPNRKKRTLNTLSWYLSRFL